MNFYLQIFGGRGAKGKFKIGGRESLTGKSIAHLPVEANSQIKTKTSEALVRQFRSEHVSKKKEFAYAYDNNGNVYGYYEGGRNSVGIPKNMLNRKGINLIHNHPSGSNFSKQDLLTFTNSNINSLTASGKKYDYVISKTTHFREQDFRRAINDAIIQGKDYNTALHNWLISRQADSGIIYKRVRRS